LNIIGISAGYHDSACCLIKDGVLVAAVQEERFSRVKNDKAIPRRSFRFCLSQAGVSIGDIDCLAYFEDPRAKLGRQLWMGMTDESSPQHRHAVLRRLTGEQPEHSFARVLGYDGPTMIVDHHLSHAASAYYLSGFDAAAILTVDGVGDWPTTTYSAGHGERIERIETVEFPHSLGLFYSALTSYLGFEVNEGEYKIMGLAPYGKPLYADLLRKLVNSLPGGQFRLDMRYFDFVRRDCMYSQALVDLLGRPPRSAGNQIEAFHMDVARSTQVILEEMMLEKVRYLHARVPCDSLCMAGGVALNVVANGRCLREGPFKRLFVQPAAGDAGGALGAAAVAHVRLTGRRPEPLKHVYLGPDNPRDEVYNLLAATPARFRDFREREPELLNYAADRLAEGKVVAWCQGRCEFGPRALGARSILADPRRPDMRDRINASVKKRESFRPFAPSVLETEQSRHFDAPHASPYMLETCQVRSALSLPAITHVDGSARLHTVTAGVNRRFAALLTEFFRRTGCPMLLNTSFNLKGEPIVLTAVDAIMCFVNSSIDILIVEDFVLERKSISPLWELVAQQRASALRADGVAPGHMVYTFL
jgi:carbamoyltransferase